MKTTNGLSGMTRVARIALSALLVGVLLATTGCSVLGRQGDESGDSYGVGGTGTPPSKAPSKYSIATPGTTLDYSAASPEAALTAEGAASSADRSSASAGTAEQLMIRTADMRIQVKRVDEAVDRLRGLTKEYGGQVESLHVSSEEQTPVYRPMVEGAVSDSAPLAAYATVRVPAKDFDKFLTQVAALGRVLVQSESGQDVTQQHIDLEARLTTLKAEESRLRDFLKSAKTVQDMLAVESELSRVRSEIESMQGQLDYLDKQIAMSALTVELVRPTPVVKPAGTDWGFADALRNGIQGAVAVLNNMITIVIALLPLIALVTLVVTVWVALARRRRRRRAATADEQLMATDAEGQIAESDGAPFEDSEPAE